MGWEHQKLIEVFIRLGAIKIEVDENCKVSATFPEKKMQQTDLDKQKKAQPLIPVLYKPPYIPGMSDPKPIDLGGVHMYMAPTTYPPYIHPTTTTSTLEINEMDPCVDKKTRISKLEINEKDPYITSKK
jgi:hypothetical protein